MIFFCLAFGTVLGSLGSSGKHLVSIFGTIDQVEDGPEMTSSLASQFPPGDHEDGAGHHVGLSSRDCQRDRRKDPGRRRHCSVGWKEDDNLNALSTQVGFQEIRMGKNLTNDPQFQIHLCSYFQGDVPAWIVHHHCLLSSVLLPVGRLPANIPCHRPEEPFVLPLWTSSGLDDCLRHSLNVISYKVFSQT